MACLQRQTSRLAVWWVCLQPEVILVVTSCTLHPCHLPWYCYPALLNVFMVQSHLLTARMDLAQVSVCVNNLLVVREYRKVFQLCEQP